MRFLDRRDAGTRLADRLRSVPLTDPVVLGVPRGGMPLAAIVADALDAPLDVVPVRALGVPFAPTVPLGAVAEDGVVVLHERLVRRSRVALAELVMLEHRARRELEQRSCRYRLATGPERLGGRTAVVVDDGAVTGSTARAACRAARARGAARVVLAVPACAVGVHLDLRAEADDVVVLERAVEYAPVGACYREFEPVGEDEVVAALAAPATAIGGPGPDMEPGVDVWLEDEGSRTAGRLVVPVDARGLVVVAHAGASGRHDAGLHRLGRRLRGLGYATVLADLLDQREELGRDRVHDATLLASRLTLLLDDLAARPVCEGLRVGVLAAATAAPGALVAAAGRGDVAAVVSRAGRADLLGRRLATVRTPTLFLVEDDPVSAELTRTVRARIPARTSVVAVDGCGDPRAEPDTLDRVAELTAGWLGLHLEIPRPGVPTPGGVGACGAVEVLPSLSVG